MVNNVRNLDSTILAYLDSTILAYSTVDSNVATNIRVVYYSVTNAMAHFVLRCLVLDIRVGHLWVDDGFTIGRQ
jgi:hypothetical protein